jgi:DHA1 family bicyclomycin/chloramphenicol resistance-like MFS transporter
MQFFSIGFFGNLRAMAMEPVGHRIAAAVTGFISTIMAVPISIFIGRFIADRRCHYLLVFDMCNIISRITYLFKNRRETGQYNSENRI